MGHRHHRVPAALGRQVPPEPGHRLPGRQARGLAGLARARRGAGQLVARSMSRKGNSGDNARAEGFFGLLKCEFFHGRDWRGWGLGDFMAELDGWMSWYREGRASQALGGSPPTSTGSHWATLSGCAGKRPQSPGAFCFTWKRGPVFQKCS